jgi:hypothetical protein
MPDVKLGQVWEVYSMRGDRWFPSTVTQIEGDNVTLRFHDQYHSTTTAMMRDRNLYRLVAEAGEAG